MFFFFHLKKNVSFLWDVQIAPTDGHCNNVYKAAHFKFPNNPAHFVSTQIGF